MCGRLSTASLTSDDIRVHFGVAEVPAFLQAYNVAPTSLIPVIRVQEHTRTLASLRWGLIPHWAKEMQIKASTFNARVETLTQKPFFRDAIKAKRCIIPASGFYEWQKVGAKKQPYYIHRVDRAPLALAGLWDAWVDQASGEVIESCTIVTVPAQHRMAEIHERMPAILEAEHFATWLDPAFRETHVLQDIARLSRDMLEFHPVSSYVSNARNEGEECIAKL